MTRETRTAREGGRFVFIAPPRGRALTAGPLSEGRGGLGPATERAGALTWILRRAGSGYLNAVRAVSGFCGAAPDLGLSWDRRKAARSLAKPPMAEGVPWPVRRTIRPRTTARARQSRLRLDPDPATAASYFLPLTAGKRTVIPRGARKCGPAVPRFRCDPKITP
jgi:hypothetical protein